nr:MAG TPA: MerR family regulatory protein [Caudoviricetes sp.]
MQRVRYCSDHHSNSIQNTITKWLRNGLIPRINIPSRARQLLLNTHGRNSIMNKGRNLSHMI